MAEHVSDELTQGAQKAVSAAKNTARSVKNVQKAASKAATGNYLGAAVDVLKDENLRRGIAIVLIVAFMLTIAIFFAAPLAIFSVIASIDGHLKEKRDVYDKAFDEAYYQGGYGRWWAGILGNIAGMRAFFQKDDDDAENAIGEQDVPDENDAYVMRSQDPLIAVYERKLAACEKKMTAKMQRVLLTMKLEFLAERGAFQRYFKNRFEEEWAHKYDDREDVRVIYDGAFAEIISSTITKEQAAALVSLYSSQINSSLDLTETVGLLKWLGYNAPGVKAFDLPLGDNTEFGFKIKAWKGTFLPQYLIDEAIGRDEYDDATDDYTSLKEYQEKYGCAMADLAIVVDCQLLSEIEAVADQIPETETVTEVKYITFRFLTYEGETPPLIWKDEETGKMCYSKAYDRDKYEEKFSAKLNQTFLMRKADAGGKVDVDNILEFKNVKVEREVEKDITEVHVRYTVPIQLTVRPVEQLVQMVGMWSGWRPYDTLYGSTGNNSGNQMPAGDTAYGENAA